MYPRCSSRLPKASKKRPQRSPSSDEEVIRRRLRGRRRRTELKTTEAGGSVVGTEEGRDRDIIDIINLTHDAKGVAEEDEGRFVEVADKGVDESDEDCCSVASSIASGPSILYNAPPKKPRSLCSACQKLYQRAKKMKAPVKNKLLDSDPKSLTCDQWVLIKTWRPRRLPNARGKLLTHVLLVKESLKVSNGAKRAEPRVGEGESSACSRPHTFLQRNLRQRVREPAKKERKKNRRKRTRDDSQAPRVAKQQRLHSNSHRQHASFSCSDNEGLHPTSGHISSPRFEVRSEQETDDSEDTHLIVELIPSSVTTETAEPREAPPKWTAPKKTGGFRDLLAQLRGSSSMIVREKY